MATIVHDSFSTPVVGGLGTADTGQVWSVIFGDTWDVNAGSALWTWDILDPGGPGNNATLAIVESSLVNGRTSATLVNVESMPNFANGIGIVLRYVDINYFWQCLLYKFLSDSRIRLQRTYAGVGPTTVLEIDIPGALFNGDVLSVNYCGDDFDVLVNDVVLGSYDASTSPQNYGTKSGMITQTGSWFGTYTQRLDDFTVETSEACPPSTSPSATPSPSASPSASASSSPSASPAPCTPPEGTVVSAVNARGRLFITLINQDNTQNAYAWHEGAQRMPISSMTNWKRSMRPLTLQELDIAFETDNADGENPLVVSVHRNLRKNYVRDARVEAGSDRVDSATANFDTENIGDMAAVFGHNIGGPGVHYIIGRIAALASPSASPSPSSSPSASPSTTESASPSGSPSASPSSSRSGSPSPSHSPSASPSASPSRSRSASPSSTPSASPSTSVSSSPSASPSAS